MTAPPSPGALNRWREEVAVDPELATAWTPLRHAAAWEQSGLEAERQGCSADAIASDFRRAREILDELGVPRPAPRRRIVRGKGGWPTVGRKARVW